MYTRGRITSPTGFVNDMEKYSALAVLGISLVRILPCQVELSDPAKGDAEGQIRGAKGRLKKNTLGIKNRWKRTPAHEIIMELFNQRGL